MKRREIFKKILGAKDAPKTINPPYFSGVFDCIDCSASCVKSCERELLSFDDVSVSFSVKNLGCNFCKKCALACEDLGKDVLNLKHEAKIEAKTSIDVSTCLAWSGVVCSSCLDSCRYKGIDFLGLFRPVINQNCINCGECLNVCFKGSIKMQGI
ncbi:4Fe-4S ferredoxin [Campylobacter gastrosuis]|uniref:4Fe-4S ferredoxin n=1 Tax=Campylobacter gastrosuis TaxID=2974576 RepID=A0ABT7HQ07_9BACT|nr:4Fe-4S ferredoxin [Campylobacter gastrosuis]MDL0088995.1 4Fe-4S ferredoxin [Campylobacter gastrosuis]